MDKNNLPEITAVIIGINVKKYLSTCIESVRNANYPQDKIKIIFSDGGSTDGSPEIARSYEGVETIELKDHSPTPGKGRNAGYRAATTPLILFLDADTILHPEFINKALPFLKDKVAAVCGKRDEVYPKKNNYHIIGSIEWVYEEGPCHYFGGDVLVRRDVLEEVNGFDDFLVAGEDPECSYRIRQKGWEIYRLTEPMTKHDLNMLTFKQYWKRAYRSGHAYAEIGLRLMGKPEKMWFKEFMRIVINASFPIFLIILSFIFPVLSFFLIPFALFVIFRNVLRTPKFQKIFNISKKEAYLYTFHLSFVVFPQFIGALRYFQTLLGRKPLTNKGYPKK
ncbi:MAG: glycosyltransferase [Calditrichaeota bacterium]|nr:MAG: glycosyltransferase [Calditrichota bacterium]